MELWYTEQHTPGIRFSVRTAQQLYHAQSAFQQLDIFESEDLGRFFTLDGLMMVAEKDEFIYHDMIVHPAMATNPAIRDVLVIGGGDGGTVRELCRYHTIQRIDLVEIDEMVIEASRQYLPFTACSLDDSRVHILCEDGLKFIRTKQNEYDLIIVDSTDPFGPGEGLFTREFYGSCESALRQDGILVNQHESPYYDYYASAMKRAHARIREYFPVCRVYQAHIPTYPSGHWLFGFASKRHDPLKADTAQWAQLGLKTRYYNAPLHNACFALPTYVRELLESGDRA